MVVHFGVEREEKVIQLALLLESREYLVLDLQVIFSNFFPNLMKQSMTLICNIIQTILIFFNLLDPFPCLKCLWLNCIDAYSKLRHGLWALGASLHFT